MTRGVMARLAAVALLLAGLTAGGATTAAAAPQEPTARASEGEQTVRTGQDTAAEGRTVGVSGAGWQPDTVVTLLLCGRNAVGGTEDCANGDSRAVTADARGAIRGVLPVVAPPTACPCVVRAVAVTGEHAFAETAFTVEGHPVKPLPNNGRTGTERLAVLGAKLEGSSGVLNWFGAPPERRLVLTVVNQGTAPARNPVFEVGTAQGVYAHEWAEQRWRGTLEPGDQKTVTLDVKLDAAAHGDYRVGVQYAQTVLAEQPWQVGRPWGLTLVGLLLLAGAGWALSRLLRLVVRRVPPRAWGARVHATRPGSAVARLRDRMEALAEPADDGTATREHKPRKPRGPRLPWLAPDPGAEPGPAARDREPVADDVSASGPSPTAPPRR